MPLSKRPLDRLKKSVTHDNLWIYILKVLKEEKTMHAYELNKKIEQRFGFKPGNVTAYLVLKRLELNGYVKKVKSTKSLGPQRNNYTITEKGAKELKAALPLLKNITKKL